jgi:hypothetical protein
VGEACAVFWHQLWARHKQWTTEQDFCWYHWTGSFCWSTEETWIDGSHDPVWTTKHSTGKTSLESGVLAKDPDAPMKLEILQNEIAQGDFSSSNEAAMVLNDSEKTEISNEWRTFRERNANLIKHWGQAFSLIQGQCTQLLQEKMKQDREWTNVSTSYDPLTLYRFIERIVLAQTEDHYPFATLYDQELSFY